MILLCCYFYTAWDNGRKTHFRWYHLIRKSILIRSPSNCSNCRESSTFFYQSNQLQWNIDIDTLNCDTKAVAEKAARNAKKANLYSLYLKLQNYRITERQNHTMLRVGSDLVRSSGQTPLPEQDHLYDVTQDSHGI